jgi:hypothetical protein
MAADTFSIKLKSNELGQSFYVLQDANGSMVTIRSTGVALRGNSHEYTVGATIADSVVNLRTALLADFANITVTINAADSARLDIASTASGSITFAKTSPDNWGDFGFARNGYAARYLFEFTDKNGNANSITIEQKDYFDDIEERDLGATNAVHRKDVSDNILGHSLEFDIEVKDGEMLGLPEFFVEDPFTFKVTLKRNMSTKFVGYVNAEQYSDPYIAPPFDVSVVASDGMGLLKQIDFDMAGKWVTEISIIAHCLNKLNLNLPISIGMSIFEFYESGTSAAMAQTYVDASYFVEANQTCYDVLQTILRSYGPSCYIVQHKGQWVITRNMDMMGSFIVHDKDGSKTGNASSPFATLEYDNAATLRYTRPVGQLSRTMIPRVKSITVNGSLGNKGNWTDWLSFPFSKSTFRAGNNSSIGDVDRYVYLDWTTITTSANWTVEGVYTNHENADVMSLRNSYEHVHPGTDWEYLSANVVASALATLKKVLFEIDLQYFWLDHGTDIYKIIRVFITNGSYYLTAAGWTTTPTYNEVQLDNRKPFTFSIEADGLPSAGPVNVRFGFMGMKTVDPADPHVYVSRISVSYFETVDIPKSVSYYADLVPISSERIEIADIPVDTPIYNSSFRNQYNFIKTRSNGLPTFQWGHSDDMTFYRLPVVIIRTEASNRRAVRQQLAGRMQLLGTNLAYGDWNTMLRFIDSTNEYRTFIAQSVAHDLFEDEIEGGFLEQLIYVDMQLDIIETIKYS